MPFFLEFSSSGLVGTEFGTKFFFFSFSPYLIPFWIEIMLEWCFLIFLYNFAIFYGIFWPGSGRNRIRDKFFFSPLSAYLIPVWIEIMPEWCFLIFCYFYWNFIARVGLKWKSRLKFFSHFLGLSTPGLDRNNAGMMFFEFFYYFLWNFLARVR